MQRLTSIAYLLALSCLTGCRCETDPHINGWNLPSIPDSYIADAEIIELGEIDEITVTPTHLMPEPETNAIYIAMPLRIAQLHNASLICYFTMHRIVKLGLESEDISCFGHEGRGPGEFVRPGGIDVAGGRIYVYDDANGRVQIFDDSFAYISSLYASYFPFKARLGSNDQFVYVPNMSKESLYSVYRGNARHTAYEKVMDFMPRVLAPGRLGGFNISHIATTTAGNVFASYSACPYILEFDSTMSLRRSIKLKGGEVDRIPRPRLAGSLSSDRRAVIVPPVVSAVAVLDSTLYVVIGYVIYKLDLWGVGGHRAYRLDIDATSDVPVADMVVTGNELFCFRPVRRGVFRSS